MMRKFVCGLFALMLVAGCSTSSDNEEADEVEHAVDQVEQGDEVGEEEQAVAADGDEPAVPEAPLWSEEGLEVQPRTGDLGDEMDREPGSTEWRDSDRPVPTRLAEGGDGAGAPASLLRELIEELRLDAGLGTEFWEQTTRIHREDDDRAIGLVMQWGLKDDSMAGMDLRVRMIRDDEAWVVEGLDERFHCRRGVTDDGLCL